MTTKAKSTAAGPVEDDNEGQSVPADETTPLIPRQDPDSADIKKERRFLPLWTKSWASKIFSLENRILFTGFLITLSFSYTQVPLFYVFHLMTCDEYYETHPPHQGSGDRCSLDEIAARAATQFSILGMSTTICGTVNLFITGWAVKKFGPRTALLMQIFIPAIRVATQILGVVAGKATGMLIIQCTQLITVFGGPAGYILVVNIIAAETVTPERRTAVFGMLQGAIMLGQGIGYLAGGMIGEAIEIRAPFDVAFASFIVSGIYARFALPYISPESMASNGKAGQGGIAAFLAPLKILVPQRLRLADGRVRKHYGLIFLCAGISIGVIATGYAPLLIQMYATAAFDFNQGDNGWLMAEFAFMRSLFLIFLFPRIISAGRRWTAKKQTKAKAAAKQVQAGSESPQHEGPVATPASEEDNTRPLLSSSSSSLSSSSSASSSSSSATLPSPQQVPTSPGEFDATRGEQVAQEPVELEENTKEISESQVFDLIFLRWSLLLDGALTTIAGFATKRWHIYLTAFLLPFGSGSAPAAKGVVTEMCLDSQRSDALNLVTLVENISRLATQGLFGFIFASLAEVGKAYGTFYCNAAVAVVAMLVLLLSHFPPPGSSLIDLNRKTSTDEDDADHQ